MCKIITRSVAFFVLVSVLLSAATVCAGESGQKMTRGEKLRADRIARTQDAMYLQAVNNANLMSPDLYRSPYAAVGGRRIAPPPVPQIYAPIIIPTPYPYPVPHPGPHPGPYPGFAR